MYLVSETCIPSLSVNGYLVMGVVVCSIWFWVQVNGILGWSGCILYIVLRIVFFVFSWVYLECPWYLAACVWYIGRVFEFYEVCI